MAEAQADEQAEEIELLQALLHIFAPSTTCVRIGRSVAEIAVCVSQEQLQREAQQPSRTCRVSCELTDLCCGLLLPSQVRVSVHDSSDFRRSFGCLAERRPGRAK